VDDANLPKALRSPCQLRPHWHAQENRDVWRRSAQGCESILVRSSKTFHKTASADAAFAVSVQRRFTVHEFRLATAFTFCEGLPSEMKDQRLNACRSGIASFDSLMRALFS